MKSLFTAGAMVAILLGGANAFADSISPSTFDVNDGAATSAQVDVYFLADTTAGMGGEVGAIQASASALLSSLSGLGNVAFGVGEYKDDPATSGDPSAFRMNSNISTDLAVAQAGINLWGASGGGEIPEADLFGLTSAANDASWRTGSQKIVVWFGNAPGHDSSLGATLSGTEVALNEQNVTVEAINVGNRDGQGQATAITKATNGTLFNGIDETGLVSAIENAVTSSSASYASSASYGTVGIDRSAVPAGIVIGDSPTPITGSFSHFADATHAFNVGLTVMTAGSNDSSLFGTVDVARVATEADHIVVESVRGPVPRLGSSGTHGVPDGGSTLIMLGAALLSTCAIGRQLKLA
jgi:hypothetical protein